MRKTSGLAAVAALAMCLSAIAGCSGEAPSRPQPVPSAVSTEPASPATESFEPSPTIPSGMVEVPDVQGRIDADEVIEAAGLIPEGIPVHGPIEEDCAGFMEAYRQKPAAGTLVKIGSKVTYRFWWESQ